MHGFRQPTQYFVVAKLMFDICMTAIILRYFGMIINLYDATIQHYLMVIHGVQDVAAGVQAPTFDPHYADDVSFCRFLCICCCYFVSINVIVWWLVLVVVVVLLRPMELRQAVL